MASHEEVAALGRLIARQTLQIEQMGAALQQLQAERARLIAENAKLRPDAKEPPKAEAA